MSDKWYNKNMVKTKISSTGVGQESLTYLYSNSIERAHLNASLVAIKKGNSRTSLFIPSSDLSPEELYVDGINWESQEIQDPDTTDPLKVVTNSLVPLLSDITVVSNTVEYDSSGIPTATVVFKIKNSAGDLVKSVNARVQLI